MHGQYVKTVCGKLCADYGLDSDDPDVANGEDGDEREDSATPDSEEDGKRAPPPRLAP